MDAEGLKQPVNVSGETNGDRHVRDGVLEDQIPADDPGDELAQGCVRVGVGAAGDGNNRGQLGVTQASKAADDGDKKERKGNGGAGAGPAGDSRGMATVEQNVEQGSFENRGLHNLFAGSGRSGEHENAGADDGANPERCQAEPAKGFLEALLRVFGIGQQLVDALDSEEL